jgi:hypothetical protein
MEQGVSLLCSHGPFRQVYFAIRYLKHILILPSHPCLEHTISLISSAFLPKISNIFSMHASFHLHALSQCTPVLVDRPTAFPKYLS